MRWKLLVAIILVGPATPTLAQPAEVVYRSEHFSTDLPLAECQEPVHWVSLKCKLADGAAGTLTLDPTLPRFNEFGEPTGDGRRFPTVTLGCTLKLVKKDKERQLYEIRGPKIVSRLTLAAFPLDSVWGDGRLLVHGKGGEIRYSISISEVTHRTIPCHPGCFPAGTAVRVPGGTTAIERVRAGDPVTTIDADGKTSSTPVRDVFITRNRVLEVRAEGGALVTTETQPVALAGGGFRPAGELKAGDRVWRWVDGRRREVAVLGVTSIGRETEVYNLVLGEPRGFIAGDFVVRSKPPAGGPASNTGVRP